MVQLYKIGALFYTCELYFVRLCTCISKLPFLKTSFFKYVGHKGMNDEMLENCQSWCEREESSSDEHFSRKSAKSGPASLDDIGHLIKSAKDEASYELTSKITQVNDWANAVH